MMLNEDERRELADIERHLTKENPRLARRFRAGFVLPPRLTLLCAVVMLLSASGTPVLIAVGIIAHAVVLLSLGGATLVIGTVTAAVWLGTRGGRRPGGRR
jgi:hypothetical protein